MLRPRADEPFFREWAARSQKAKRSLSRAKQVMQLLGVDPKNLPRTLTVVGSKGKGTTVAAATATLVSQGYKVGSVISPAFRSNRERIRVDGRAVDQISYEKMSRRLADVLKVLEPSTDGYLSPSGAFLCTAASYFRTLDLDFLVLEEGMGGASDEISFFSPSDVAITPVFLEHGEALGFTISKIVTDLLGVATADTQRIWTAPNQNDAAMEAIRQNCEEKGIPLEIGVEPKPLISALDHIPGLSRANAGLGSAVALSMLRGEVDLDAAQNHLSTLVLPGRLSVHKKVVTHNTSNNWIVDAAINSDGAAAALSWTREHFGEPDLVLLCVPLNKDRQGCLQALSGTRLVELTTTSHLTFATDHRGQRFPTLDEALVEGLAPGGTVLALGTITFVADVLEVLDAETESWFP